MTSKAAIAAFLQTSRDFDERQNGKNEMNTNKKAKTNAIKMSEKVSYDRRRFLGTAAMAIAAAEVGMIGFADAPSNKQPSGLEGE